jgi:hypothetical protein
MWPSAAVCLPRHVCLGGAWQPKLIEYGTRSDQILYRGAQSSIGPTLACGNHGYGTSGGNIDGRCRHRSRISQAAREDGRRAAVMRAIIVWSKWVPGTNQVVAQFVL